ncbi:helix-turn-helix domain-containing protein [Floridanema evergladense]|uniref:Helix-turn-helix domain-containing protein n=1 Tax=Floridaenema evergladense BLCC-F167 TaxID=3153639 RepID=A0ABV4WQ18_9CYAN
MKKQYNFQNWLQTKVSDDPEVVLAGKLEYLRLYLTDAMRELRTKAGLTQAQLAEKLGVQQAAVSKLESALKDHELESVLNYLHKLDADLLVAVKQGNEFYQVSDNSGILLVDLPVAVQELATSKGMSLREYVQAAIEHFSSKGRTVRESVTAFLESDDVVAVQVLERMAAKSPVEIAIELEKCLSISDEEERTFAIKNALAGGIRTGDNNRDASDEDDQIELLDLAESLLEKLAKILEYSVNNISNSG